ncbi:MAG: hypothetical protein IJX76_04070 [Clostridia bacterium]|nr:hypothetical protein [Clostridia bacterium]
MKQSKTPGTCVSVFKNGGRTTCQKNITEMWIALINKLEKSKHFGASVK